MNFNIWYKASYFFSFTLWEWVIATAIASAPSIKAFAKSWATLNPPVITKVTLWAPTLSKYLRALANAGISLEVSSFIETVLHPVTLGVTLGLIVGKFIGIAGVSWVLLKMHYRMAVLKKMQMGRYRCFKVS
mgnify:CR=1 FL=1